MKKLKLSNFWENFDDFVELCNTSGKNDTRAKIKNILSKDFNSETGMYQGNWESLLNDVLYIFVNDKRVASKFDYDKAFLDNVVFIFTNKYDQATKKLTTDLFEKLKDNFYGGLQWGAPTKFYEKNNTIFLTKKIDEKKLVFIKGNLKDLNNFWVTVDNFTILVNYENGKYVQSFNTETGRRTQISKYPEIIYFINAKYFNSYITNLSFNQFKYLTTSFIGNGNLFLPSSDGFGRLSSVMSQRIIGNINDLLDYFKQAENNYGNIRFTYNMISESKFEIFRPEEELLKRSIQETENLWGDARSANKSRKGPIRTPKN